MSLDVLLLLPALVAGLVVVATHVPLGRRVLARGVVFLDLAIAQVASLGVIAALAMGWDLAGWQAQVAAMVAALLAATLLVWTDRRWPHVQEALIGVLFVSAASAEFVLLADNPHAGEHVKDMLAGQILWVTWDGLIPLGIISAVILVLWAILGDRLGPRLFYTLFALAITQSVQIVGIYLVFATLILPALAARAVAPHRATVVGYATGGLGYGGGLLISGFADVPSGPAIVLALLAMFLTVSMTVRFRLRRPEGDVDFVG
jgi:zinc/manganese transport system permease protein